MDLTPLLLPHTLKDEVDWIKLNTEMYTPKIFEKSEFFKQYELYCKFLEENVLNEKKWLPTPEMIKEWEGIEGLLFESFNSLVYQLKKKISDLMKKG